MSVWLSHILPWGLFAGAMGVLGVPALSWQWGLMATVFLVGRGAAYHAGRAAR